MEELGSDIRQGVLSGNYDIDSNAVNALGLLLRAVGVEKHDRHPDAPVTVRSRCLGPDDHKEEDGSIVDDEGNVVVNADGTVPEGSSGVVWDLDGNKPDDAPTDDGRRGGATTDEARNGAATTRRPR